MHRALTDDATLRFAEAIELEELGGAFGRVTSRRARRAAGAADMTLGSRIAISHIDSYVLTCTCDDIIQALSRRALALTRSSNCR